MDIQEIKPSPLTAPPDNSLRSIIERRRSVRKPVLKSAKVIFAGGHSIYNCLVLDESPDGAFVDMGQVITLPDEVILQYGTGATFRAQRRWSMGSKIGFQFIGGQIISQEIASRLLVFREILKNHGLPAAMRMLRETNFFDNVELRHIAEAAEAAYVKFDSALAGNSLF